MSALKGRLVWEEAKYHHIFNGFPNEKFPQQELTGKNLYYHMFNNKQCGGSSCHLHFPLVRAQMRSSSIYIYWVILFLLLLLIFTNMQKRVKSYMSKKELDFCFIINILKEKNLTYFFQQLSYFHVSDKCVTIKLFLLHYTSSAYKMTRKKRQKMKSHVKLKRVIILIYKL